MAAILLAGASSAAGPVPGGTWKNPKDGMDFVWVPAGSLRIGCEKSLKCSETIPERDVQFTGFWMGRTEVTLAQFRAFVQATGYRTSAEQAEDRFTWLSPGFAQGPDHPVVGLSFDDAVAYTRWADVDVPNYLEWEYAARAGSPHAFYWGGEFDGRYAWWRGNAGYGTHPVAQKQPNAYGLYDVSGNAFEWSRWDITDPSKCSGKIGSPRGGSWAMCFLSLMTLRQPFPTARCQTDGGWNDDRGFRCIRRLNR